jgi:DNA repair protein RadC
MPTGVKSTINTGSRNGIGKTEEKFNSESKFVNMRKQLLQRVKNGHIGSGISIKYKSEILYSKPIEMALDIYEWVLPRWSKELINLQEQSMVLFLNNRNHLIPYRLISTGNLRRTTVNVQLVVSLALHTMASKVILVHNHPSGNLTASCQDIRITKKVKAV